MTDRPPFPPPPGQPDPALPSFDGIQRQLDMDLARLMISGLCSHLATLAGVDPSTPWIIWPDGLVAALTGDNAGRVRAHIEGVAASRSIADDATDDDDENANQDRGDDLDRTEADGGQPTLAPGTPDGPVGHDHGGAPSEPESATQSDPASAPPGRAPTTEDLDPLDPGHLVYMEADDAIATVGQACASLGIEVDDAPIEVAS